MSNELVPAGGGAVVPADTGGAVGEHVGDMSVDRGGAPGDELSVSAQLLHGEVQRAAGVALSRDQIRRVYEVMKRHREAEDAQDKRAATAKMRAEWGSANYDNRIARIHEWLKALPEDLSEAILGARDADFGTPICSKPEILRAMYQVAKNFPVDSDDTREKAAAERELKVEWKSAYDSNIFALKSYLGTLPKSAQEGILDARDSEGVAILNRPAVLKWLLQLARPRFTPSQGGAPPDLSAINSARRREIEAWMGAKNGSADYKKYWNDEKVQAEYRELTNQGGANASAHSTADTDLERRIAEIESWIGTRRYSGDEAVQQELRELYDRRERARK